MRTSLVMAGATLAFFGFQGRLAAAAPVADACENAGLGVEREAGGRRRLMLQGFLKQVMPDERFKVICPLIGAYTALAKPITLMDVYGVAKPAALRAAIIADFEVRDLLPAVDAGPNLDAATDDPSWTQAVRICGTADMKESKSVYHRRDRCVDLDDTLDWLVIQLALRRSADAARPFILELPRTLGSYVVNQSLSVSAGTHLRWTPDADGAYSEVALAGSTDNGTIFTNMNPYSLDLSPTIVRELVKNITFDNPRISGSNIAGENGISVARGGRDIVISGGEIRNVLFDTTRQGGRAVQCEQGCDGLLIQGLRISHSTFGISSGVIQKNNHLLQAFGNLMQSRLTVRDVEMDDVEVPFSILNTKLDSSFDPVGQSVQIDGVRIRNSGALNRAHVRDGNVDVFSYQPNDGSPRVWCHDRQRLEAMYDLSTGSYGPQASGIFYIQSGRNIRIRNVTVVNQPDYPKIGGLFRGESGHAISIVNVDFRGKAQAVFNLTGGLTGPASGAIRLQDVSFERIRANGEFDYAILSADELPVVRARPENGTSPGGDRCVRSAEGTRFRALRWSNVTVNGRSVGTGQTESAASYVSERAR